MRAGRLLPLLGIALVAAVALPGCVADSRTTSPPSPAVTASPIPPPDFPAPSAPDTVTFVGVIDGDTVETSVGTVRLIGIDTPERGACGHEEASRTLVRLVAPGDRVRLELPDGQNDLDRYGRLIRYVHTPAGVDLGYAQLEAGNAIARYDSRDGFPAHPREGAYHAAQLAALAADGTVITSSCAGRR